MTWHTPIIWLQDLCCAIAAHPLSFALAFFGVPLWVIAAELAHDQKQLDLMNLTINQVGLLVMFATASLALRAASIRGDMHDKLDALHDKVDALT